MSCFSCESLLLWGIPYLGAYRNVFIPKNLRDELGCTLDKVEMETGQRSALAIETNRERRERQIVQRARVRGLLALTNSTRGNKRIEFVNRDLNAAIHTRRCAALKKGPRHVTRASFTWQHLRVEMHHEELNAGAGNQLKKKHWKMSAGGYVYLPSIVVKRFLFHRTLHRDAQLHMLCTCSCFE